MPGFFNIGPNIQMNFMGGPQNQQSFSNAFGGTGGFMNFPNNSAQPSQHEYEEDSSNYAQSEMYYDDEDVGVEYMPNDDYEGEEQPPSEEELRNVINSYECQVFRPQEGEENPVCTVCMENIKSESMIKNLKCNHKFHPKCINEWLKRKLICPMCKSRVEVKE